MKTVSVRLPEQLFAQIEAEAQARGCSKAEVVRERLTLANKSPRDPIGSLDSIRDLIGSVDGLPPDLGSRYKEYLRLNYGRKRRR